MRIIEKRLLRGPNLYAASPCLMALVENRAITGRGFGARLLALMPALAHTGAARLADDAMLVDALEPVLMALQRLAGAPAGQSSTLPVLGHPARRRVVCGYAIEQVASQALTLAIALLEALAREQPFDLASALTALRETGADYALDASTGAVLDAALKRGIPALRLSEESNLFQLGWGSRQKRLQATMTGATNSIAVGIAGDRHLTRTLLEQAGVPVPEGDMVTTVEAAQRLARRIARPVVLKPQGALQGKGVTLGCATPQALADAFALARRHGRRVIVEEYLQGRNYRVLVTGGKIAAASWRRGPHVIGNGRATIRELVET